MPAGPGGSNATVGWTRFYGLTTSAAKDKARAANTVKLIEWFGGKAEGNYTFQKLIFNDIGAVDWDQHLPRMVDFWDKALFRSGDYRGNPLRKPVDRQLIEVGPAFVGKHEMVPGRRKPAEHNLNPRRRGYR